MPRKSTTKAALKIVEPQTLFDRINRLHDEIERRAFGHFERDGRFGRDLEHWLRAEAEILHPVHVSISESGNAFHVSAEVPGFNVGELEVSLEPHRLTISGRRDSVKQREKKGRLIYSEQCSSELLRIIDLPAEIDAAKTTATLKDGILELEMPKGAQAIGTRVAVRAA
jgi:HSP20 family protein